MWNAVTVDLALIDILLRLNTPDAINHELVCQFKRRQNRRHQYMQGIKGANVRLRLYAPHVIAHELVCQYKRREFKSDIKDANVKGISMRRM